MVWVESNNDYSVNSFVIPGQTCISRHLLHWMPSDSLGSALHWHSAIWILCVRRDKLCTRTLNIQKQGCNRAKHVCQYTCTYNSFLHYEIHKPHRCLEYPRSNCVIKNDHKFTETVVNTQDWRYIPSIWEAMEFDILWKVGPQVVGMEISCKSSSYIGYIYMVLVFKGIDKNRSQLVFFQMSAC